MSALVDGIAYPMDDILRYQHYSYLSLTVFHSPPVADFSMCTFHYPITVYIINKLCSRHTLGGGNDNMYHNIGIYGLNNMYMEETTFWFNNFLYY